jgi:hypothetical protein
LAKTVDRGEDANRQALDFVTDRGRSHHKVQ